MFKLGWTYGNWFDQICSIHLRKILAFALVFASNFFLTNNNNNNNKSFDLLFDQKKKKRYTQILLDPPTHSYITMQNSLESIVLTLSYRIIVSFNNKFICPMHNSNKFNDVIHHVIIWKRKRILWVSQHVWVLYTCVSMLWDCSIMRYYFVYMGRDVTKYS